MSRYRQRGCNANWYACQKGGRYYHSVYKVVDTIAKNYQGRSWFFFMFMMVMNMTDYFFSEEKTYETEKRRYENVRFSCFFNCFWQKVKKSNSKESTSSKANQSYRKRLGY